MLGPTCKYARHVGLLYKGTVYWMCACYVDRFGQRAGGTSISITRLQDHSLPTPSRPDAPRPGGAGAPPPDRTRDYVRSTESPSSLCLGIGRDLGERNSYFLDRTSLGGAVSAPDLITRRLRLPKADGEHVCALADLPTASSVCCGPNVCKHCRVCLSRLLLIRTRCAVPVSC